MQTPWRHSFESRARMRTSAFYFNDTKAVLGDMAVKIAGTTLLLCLAAATQLWALPPCPASRVLTITASVVGTSHGGVVNSHAITMNPCEEFWVDISASTADVNANTLVYVNAYNTFGTNLGSKNFGLAWYGSLSFSQTNAIPIASGGFPLPGTRDPRSLVTHIDVYADNAQAAYPVTYTLTVHLHARPTYNRGGLSYSDAFGPLANGTVLHASMWSGEVNYYRVSLQPSGTLTLSGSFVNKNWSFSTAVNVKIYDGAQVFRTTILNQGVAANSAQDPAGASVNFTSSTFTNTSAQSQDFYIVIENSVGARISDSTITLAGDLLPPPVLTLYLDADPLDLLGKFDVNHASDHSNYVPGADLATGASVTLPQSLQLIAAYVNANGQIVPPPGWASSQVRFNLSDTSAFVGVAMNWGNDGAEDFNLPAANCSTFGPGGRCIEHNAGFGNDYTARIALSCNDYGGFTTASVAVDDVNAASLRLPQYVNSGNILPAVGWYAEGFHVTSTNLLPTSDDDGTPTGVYYSQLPWGLTGDGLSAYEEYRGFFVDGQHRRLNPAKKDLFVTYHPTWGIGYATDLERLAIGMRVHQIRGLLNGASVLEHDDTGVVNFRYLNLASGGSNIPGAGGVYSPQKALRPSVVDTRIPGYFGFCRPLEVAPKVPLDVTDIEIWVTSIMVLSDPQDYKQIIGDDPDGPFSDADAENEVRRTFAHELAHGIAICHPGPGACYGIDSSVRVPPSVMGGTQRGVLPTDPACQYETFEQGLIRLHRRF
jgi:hypothetical protein